jgi:3-isopropylmalate dehydrogenase
MKAKITLLAGDGIGPEVVAVAKRVLERVAELGGHDFRFDDRLIGGAAIDDAGEPLPAVTLDACRQSDAVLLGAVGGPAWDDAPARPEHGLLALRQGLAVYANLRPVRIYPALVDRSAIRPEVLEGVDLLVVRELTSGLYFGRPKCREVTPRGRRAIDSLVYHEHEIARVVTLACQLAKGRQRRVVSIDKANVLETGQLWRQVATEVAATHSDIELSHQLVDAAATINVGAGHALPAEG